MSYQYLWCICDTSVKLHSSGCCGLSKETLISMNATVLKIKWTIISYWLHTYSWHGYRIVHTKNNNIQRNEKDSIQVRLELTTSCSVGRCAIQLRHWTLLRRWSSKSYIIYIFLKRIVVTFGFIWLSVGRWVQTVMNHPTQRYSMN